MNATSDIFRKCIELIGLVSGLAGRESRLIACPLGGSFVSEYMSLSSSFHSKIHVIVTVQQNILFD